MVLKKQFFILASYSTLNYIEIGGRIFDHDIKKSLGNQNNGHLFD